MENVNSLSFLEKYFKDSFISKCKKETFEYDKNGEIVRMKDGVQCGVISTDSMYSDYQIKFNIVFDSISRLFSINIVFMDFNKTYVDNKVHHFRIPIFKDGVGLDAFYSPWAHRDTKDFIIKQINQVNPLEGIKEYFINAYEDEGLIKYEEMLFKTFIHNSLMYLLTDPNNLFYATHNNEVYAKPYIENKSIIYKKGKDKLWLIVTFHNLNSHPKYQNPTYEIRIELLHSINGIEGSLEFGFRTTTVRIEGGEVRKLKLYHHQSREYKEYTNTFYDFESIYYKYTNFVKKLFDDGEIFNGMNRFLNK